MNSIDSIQKAFNEHIKELFSGHAVSPDLSKLHINVDESKQAFGNLSTSVALVLAKALKRVPREVATEIATTFTHPLIEKIEVAGPGFINMHFKPETFKLLAQELYEQKE